MCVFPESSTANTSEPPSQSGPRIIGYGSQFRSSEAVSTRRSPPPDGITATWPWRGSSKIPGRYRYAISLPSGDHDGNAAYPSWWVRSSGSPPSASSTYRSRSVVVSQSSSRAEENAILVPSGDHAGLSSSKSPSVSCRAGSDPSAFTTNRCSRRSPVQPSSSSLYCSRVNRLGPRFFGSSSSYAASGTRDVNAIRVPSGDHTSWLALCLRSVSLRGSPPATGMR